MTLTIEQFSYKLTLLKPVLTDKIRDDIIVSEYMTTTTKNLLKRGYNAAFADLAETLTVAGMNWNNALVYLSCLQLGPSPVWDIAKLSGIKRSTCYLILDELKTEGIAAVSYDGIRKIFTVISPRQLIDNLKNKYQSLENILPQLETIGSNVPNKPKIRIYEGVEGIRQAYQLSLELPENSEFLIYGNPDVLNSYPQMIKRYLQMRVARKIRVMAIIPDSASSKEVLERDQKELRLTRLLPREKFNQQTETHVLPDKLVYIAHSENQPFATVIESATLASEERSRFEFLWDLSK
jgi:sugar-specific transcriptional regulator TrmB